MHILRSTAVAVMAIAVSLAAQQPAAPPPQGQAPLTFKVEVNYVEIDATVTDAQGAPVRGLSRDDFQVLEEGRPQALTVFADIALPVERTDAPLFRASAVEPDVRSNRRDFDGRVFVLLLDDLHTTFSRTGHLRNAALLFIQRFLGANDVAAVVRTSGTGAAQEFTSSRPLLLRAVNRFMGQKIAPASTVRTESGDPEEAQRAFNARRLLNELQKISEYLAGVRGRRKAVVLFSEGIDYDITGGFENRSASDILSQLREAVGAAGRGNVSFYTIDPRGLAGMEAFDAQMGSSDTATMSSMFDESRRAQDSLRVLAEQTGGVAAVNRNDYRETFERIIRDNSSYYVLGYYSDNTRRDGRYRSVEVKVRRPGLTVRARKGYVAPRGNPAAAKSNPRDEASPEVREALNSPIPVSGLPFSVSAVPFRGGTKDASVLLVLEVEGGRFQFADKGGTLWDQLELAAIPFDANGNAKDGVRDTVAMTPRPPTRDLILARGIRVTRRLSLAPGRYQLRVGLREAGAGAVGSVPIDLEVPDFSKGDLTMSGLAVTSRSADSVPTAQPDEQLKGVLPAQPTTMRDFARGDQITLFAEIYDSVRAAHRLEINTTATADDGKVVYSHRDERASSELTARGDGFGHVGAIPLKDFAPGRYVVRVEARALIGDRPAAVRELELTVR